MVQQDNTKNIHFAVVFFALAYAASVSILSVNLNSVALYVVLPIAFAVTFVANGGLKTNWYEKMLMFLCGWAFISYLWSSYPLSAFHEMKRLLGVILLTYVISANAKNIRFVPAMYFVYIIYLVGCWIYAKTHMLLDAVVMDEMTDTRMNDQTLNANTFAYFTAFCSFSLYQLSNILNSMKWRKVCEIAFLMMLPLSFVTALLTASRQTLLVQLPLMSILLYIRYLWDRSGKRKTIVFLVIVAAIYISVDYVMNIYENSYLFERVQSDLTEDARLKLIVDAYNVGLDNFPIGVGAGNYVMYSYNRHFSHVTYLELWANLGILGVYIFLSMLYRFIKTQYQRYMITKDKMYMEFLGFGVIFCFQNVFYSFYADMWLMGFFVLVASHSEIYYKERYLQNN